MHTGPSSGIGYWAVTYTVCFTKQFITHSYSKHIITGNVQTLECASMGQQWKTNRQNQSTAYSEYSFEYRTSFLVNFQFITLSWHRPFHTTIRNSAPRINHYPDSKVHGSNMGPIWAQTAPDGPHVGHMNFTISVFILNTLQRAWW